MEKNLLLEREKRSSLLNVFKKLHPFKKELGEFSVDELQELKEKIDKIMTYSLGRTVDFEHLANFFLLKRRGVDVGKVRKIFGIAFNNIANGYKNKAYENAKILRDIDIEIKNRE